MRIRPERWIWALPLLGGLWVGATITLEERIAGDLMAAAAPVVGATAEPGGGEPWLAVSVTGRDLVASGEAPGIEARGSVLDKLARLPGVRQLDDRIGTVAVPPQFTLTAVWDGTRLRAEGFRPAELGKAAFVERLRAELPGGVEVADATRAGSGSPEAFVDLAAFAVRQLASLSSGTATLTGRTLSLKGEAPDPESYNAVRAALRALPGGAATGTIEIEPPLLRPFLWSAERQGDGSVVLAGHVPSEGLRTELKGEAERIAPGLVADRMQTARGAPAGLDFSGATRFALAELAQLQHGTVALEEERLSLRGAAIRGAIPGLVRAFEGRLPKGLRPGPVELRPAIVEPYLFTARRTADALVLEGYYPDERTREALLSFVRSRLFGEPVLDRGRLADGAPPNFQAGAEAALAQLSYLATGEAAIRGTVLSLTGESLYAQAAERVPQALSAAAPAGWTVSAEVKVRRGGPGSRP